jgi:hypothetical protein
VSNVVKIAIPLLLIAAAAGGAFYFLNQEPVAPVAPPEQTTKVTSPAKPEPKTPEVADIRGPAVQPDRVKATGANGNSHASAEQGVKGRVLLPNGQPAVGIPVMLLENAMSNPIDMFLRNKMGQVTPPLATAVTVADGSFALGITKEDQSVDLRVVSEQHPEFTKAPIQLHGGEWWDCGDITLEVGLVVQGRVTEVQSKAAVANATVFLNASNRSHAMAATPGRERGISVVTDGGGNYRFENAPRQGLIDLIVESEGYATTTLLRQQIKADAPNEFPLEIERGSTITGVVVDENGQRINSAKLVATGHSNKTPQTESVFSNAEGEFRFPALRSGPYRLTASANNFADVDIPLVLTDEDIKVVMPKRGSVKLRVFSSKNRPLKSYRLGLKRAFANNPDNIGNVLEFPDRTINPSNYKGEWAIIEGLPSGLFKFQLTERNHAKTLSEPFTVEQGMEGIEVTVVLTNGGEITGTVIDDTGKPVAGAAVASDMNSGIAGGSQLFDIFRSMIPEKHTSRTVRTDAQGRFRIPSLSFADYMIRVSHDQYCEGTAVNIKLLEEGQVVDAGVIQLSKGTLVEGTTTIDGNPAGQIKVVISMPTPTGQQLPAAQPQSPEALAEAAKRLFSVKVLSDGDGRFRMMKRVPPGTYKITAARQSTESPFTALLDMKQSEQVLIVGPGQDRAVVNFNLSSN